MNAKQIEQPHELNQLTGKLAEHYEVESTYFTIRTRITVIESDEEHSNNNLYCPENYISFQRYREGSRYHHEVFNFSITAIPDMIVYFNSLINK